MYSPRSFIISLGSLCLIMRMKESPHAEDAKIDGVAINTDKATCYSAFVRVMWLSFLPISQ